MNEKELEFKIQKTLILAGMDPEKASEVAKDRAREMSEKDNTIMSKKVDSEKTFKNEQVMGEDE